MDLDFRRIYYYAVLGALGGLTSWAIIGLVLRFNTTNIFLLFLKDALLGAVVGVCIGAAIGSYDGLIANRSIPKLARGMFLSGGIGLVGGMVGLVFSEAIFTLGGGGVWPRALGWALFGLLVGTGEGIGQRALSKVGYGALGGLLGGLMGGSTYERLSVLLRALTHDRELALSVGGAVGLVILGACIGALIGLVEVILRPAWLRFTRGRLEGQTRTLDPRGPVHVLGRADSCTIVVPGDPDVAPQHAEIRREGREFVIVPRDGAVLLYSPRGYTPVNRHVLHSDDVIQLGKSRMVFCSERRGGGQ